MGTKLSGSSASPLRESLNLRVLLGTPKLRSEGSVLHWPLTQQRPCSETRRAATERGLCADGECRARRARRAGRARRVGVQGRGTAHAPAHARQVPVGHRTGDSWCCLPHKGDWWLEGQRRTPPGPPAVSPERAPGKLSPARTASAGPGRPGVTQSLHDGSPKAKASALTHTEDAWPPSH